MRLSCRFSILLIALLCFAQASLRAETVSQFPFQYRDGFIWLKVAVPQRREPLNFLLDSGAASSVLDLQTARQLGVKFGGSQTVQGVHSQAVARQVKDFDARISDVALPNSLLALDLSAVSKTCSQKIDGLLGADFFRRRVVQLDFTAGCVRLLNQADPVATTAQILPIKTCNNAFCIPVCIAGSAQQWMRLDTGCDSALEWVVSDAKSKALRGSSIGLSNASVRYLHTEVQLGAKSFSAVKTGVHEQQIFCGESGLIGNPLLSHFRVTIDAQRKHVVLEPK